MKILNIKAFIFVLLFYIQGYAQTIKVVYNYGTTPVKFTDLDGQANGILIDIWRLWATKNNIKIKFIEASWEDSLAMVQDGRADVHAGLFYTIKRNSIFDFTEKPLYKSKNYFFYNKYSIDVKSTADFQPFVVAVGNGYINTFMKANYPKLVIKSYKTDDDASIAFMQGKVNVLVSDRSTLAYLLKKNNHDIEQYKYNDKTYVYTKKYYGAVKKGNKKLLKTINKGFDNITKEELKKIKNRWKMAKKKLLKEYHYKKAFFNKKQLDYLHKKKEIKMCVDPKWLPFEAIEKGKHIGIIAEIFKKLKQSLPIPIKLVETKNWNESIRAIQDKKCDILAGAVHTLSRDKFLNFTQPYMMFPEVIVTREDEPFIEDFKNVIDEKIGIVKGSAIITLIKNKHPAINLVEVDTVSDGLMQVSQGKLYGFLNTSASISYYIKKEGMTNLKIASKVGVNYEITVAVRNDEIELLNIFNILIDSLDKNIINDIKENWIKVNVQKIVDYSIIYKIVALFLLIIVIILYWNRKLNREIIEKEKVQKELRKLFQVIEQSQVSVMITDLNGVIEYVNPFCISQTGYSKDELLSQNPSILKSGYQDELFYKNLWSTIRKGKTWSGEFSNKSKDGTIFWESAVIAPIFDENRKIKYFASIKENITEKVKGREKLELAQEEAIKANSAKSEFLAKMSHEIRTPMNAVLGMLYLLGKTEVSVIQDNYIKKAHSAANSLLGIINDILDFSKIEAGKLDIHNEEFELNSVIMDVLSVMSFKAEEKNLELLAHYDSSMPNYIISDKLRIGQILTNILSNAIKFTTRGEVIISTKLIKEQENDIVIMFCVKDSGLGISKLAQEKLFQEFSQVDSSVTRNFEGTGLGLAISKKLVELLGGEIWIEESKEGVGTTFCFTIQCTKTSKILKNKFDYTQISNLKCLVVDDNNAAIEILTEMLGSFNYKVDSVLNGKDAINYIKNNKYDIVFLDYKMDDLNGIETYKIVKDDLKRNNTKTIIVSAYSKDIIDENLQKEGIEGYLSKPIFPSALYNKIFEVQHSINDNIINQDADTKMKYFKNMTILLVEDNKLNQEFALHILEERGLNVDIASDGIEALVKIKNKGYDLVLMDVQMPHMDGLEATKHIRQLEGDYFKKVPIIALSANALFGDKEKSLECGMNEHITKPIDPIELFDVLSRYLISEEKTIDIIANKDTNIFLGKLDKTIFDVEHTVSKLNDSYEVYIQILKQFSSQYHDICKELELFIKARDIKSLQNKVHEIKGVCGNIGAIKLFNNLTKMDLIIQKGEFPNDNLLNEFKNELKVVLEAINNLENEKLIVKEFDKDKVIVLLKDLENNLEEDIVVSDKLLREVMPYLEKNYQDFSKKLLTSINEFDTDQAKKLISDFIKDTQ